MAAAFYLIMTVVAIVWSGWTRKEPPIWVGGMPSSDSVLRWTLVGLCFGIAVVAATALGTRYFGFVRALERMFYAILGPISWPKAFLLALFSAIGEELLFRGAIQPSLGLVPASLLFALAHWPVHPILIPWTLMAGLLGLVFGWSVEQSGHLAAPIVAHFVINLINLHAIGTGRTHFELPHED